MVFGMEKGDRKERKSLMNSCGDNERNPREGKIGEKEECALVLISNCVLEMSYLDG